MNKDMFHAFIVGLIGSAFAIILCEEAIELNNSKKPIAIRTNTVTLTNYVTVTNVVSAKWKCPHHDNPWHETTENCLDYEK